MTTRATRGPRRRTVVALAVILSVLVAFVVRLIDIQVVSADEHVSQSLEHIGDGSTIPGQRGSIVDAEGTPRETRVYPNGAVAGNVLGFLDNTGEAKAGIEQLEESCLAPVDGEKTYRKGKDGVVIPGSESVTDAVNGGTVQLTINSDLQ
ncbi:unnamed protein product, partial [Penicillium discolor]